MATGGASVYHAAMSDSAHFPVHMRLTGEQLAAVRALAEIEHRKVAAMLALLVAEALATRQTQG
jgi:hypothetical protein